MIGMVLLALLPVTLLIGLGYGLRRSGFLAEAFWPQAERLCYYVLLPSLFLHGLATADLKAVPVWGLAATLVVSLVTVAVLVMAARPLMPIDGAAFTSVFQGSIRFNNYIGVALAAGMLGPVGVTLAAVCNAAIVPTVNLLTILVFARFGSARLTLRGAVVEIATNPLIIGCLGGMLLQGLGVGLPFGLEPALKALGAASMPIGLVCVGAALDFSAARSWLSPLLTASAMKFIATPGVTFLAGKALGLDARTMTVALLFQTLPTASSSYIMAKQLGGDAPLMAGVTAVQTVLALLAIPLVIGVLLG